MKSADQSSAVPAERPATEAGNGFGGGQKRLGGTCPQGTDDSRRNGLQLTEQEGRTGLNFTRFRGPVSGRAAFDHVADVDFFPLQSQGPDHVVQEFAGASDKRSSLPVLIQSRPFPDKHQSGLRGTLSKNKAAAAAMEPAAAAVPQFLPDFQEAP